MGKRKRAKKPPDDPFEGHLSYRDQGIVVDADLLRWVERLRSWFRVYCDAEIVERMQAEGIRITGPNCHDTEVPSRGMFGRVLPTSVR